MPANRLPAKTRASRENIKKAHEARRQKAVEKRLQTLAESAKTIEEKISEAKRLMPDMIETEIHRYLESMPKRDTVKLFKESLFRAFQDAGGYERLKKLAKDDKTFMKLVDQCAALAKREPESRQSSGPAVQVIIEGLYPEPIIADCKPLHPDNEVIDLFNDNI